MTQVDPQFSLVNILKPYAGFEDVYEGQAANTPISFHPADKNGVYQPLDPDAGRPGFADNLLRYVDVPLGSRIAIWIPRLLQASAFAFITEPYIYTIFWRLRNVTDYRNRRTPFQMSDQFPGAQDTSGGTIAQRFIYPAANDTVIITQAEASGQLAQVNNLRREQVEYDIASVDAGNLPLLPNGTEGVHQQGVVDPAIYTNPNSAGLAFFAPRIVPCLGNQMLITATRAIDTNPNWAFSGVDNAFSNVYGVNVIGPQHPLIEKLGIYVYTGTAP